jgi:raffinose synthase
MGVGSDPYKLLERGFAAVADRTGTFRVRGEKMLPAHMEDFGWCTWDAFYSKVRFVVVRMHVYM